MRILRLLIATATAALAVAALASGAGARSVSPADSGPVSAASSGSTLLTPLFGLFEVDLASLGVSDAALATVGPQAAPAPETDGDNLLTVDNDLLDCPNAEFVSIQAAVDAADPYDNIKVCRGVYLEQVDIPAGKEGLTLFSVGYQQAVIKAPPVMAEPGDLIRVSARDVTIRHFLITGPLPDTLFCSVETRTGVRVGGGGSLKLWDNHITEIRATNPALYGCQNGIAVRVGQQSQNQVGTADIAHNLIDKYQKGGIVVDGDGTYAEVHHNEIVGVGPQPAIAPNGIQVSRDARADVHHNEVSGNSYSLGGAAGTGVLLFELVGGVDVGYNDVYRNDDGISLYESQGLLVEHNRSHDQLAYDGLYADTLSTGNRFEYNRAYYNFEHDCHDDSAGTGSGGSANFWIKDYGLTQNRPGLCKKATP